MSYLLNNQQKFNDVVFENRNKEYGAYAIRSDYGNTLFKSLSFIGLAAGSFALAAFLLNRPVAEEPKSLAGQVRDTEIHTMMDLERDKKPEAAASQKTPKPDAPKASAAGATTIIDSLAVQTTSQSLNEDLPTASATTGSTGAVRGPDTGSGTASITVSGGGTVTTTIAENFGVDSQPEFPGGLNALYKFIAAHVRYPGPAADGGVEGTMHVRFVVDEQGRVGSLELRNKLGFGLDEEAKRVVGMLPDFKTPAKIKGQPVKMYYQLPIKFKLR